MNGVCLGIAAPPHGLDPPEHFSRNFDL